MSSEVPSDHPLRRVFSALVQGVFLQSLGLRDPELAEYVANLLVAFVHLDCVHRIRDARGRPLEEITEMLMEGDMRLTAPSFNREREVHKHIGDFALFWTGVYPEALTMMRAATRKDHLISYVEQGKRSYYIASTFDFGELRREAEILRQLSEQFELCVYGLNLVRREWEKMGELGASYGQ